MRTIHHGKEQPNPIELSTESRITLSDFRKHLKVKGLRGVLYIDGIYRGIKCNGNTILQLNSASQVELRQRTLLREQHLFQVSVYFDQDKEPIKFKCPLDTTVDELKFLVQDRCGIPASDLSFKSKINPDKKALDYCSPRNKLVVIHSPNVPEEEMTPTTLLWVSKVMLAWKDLAKYLDLCDSKIHAIENDNNNSTEEKRFKMFWHWHRQNGRNATWRALVKASYRADVNLARNIMEVCKLLYTFFHL